MLGGSVASHRMHAGNMQFSAAPLSPLLLLVLPADVSYPHLLYIDSICSVHASEISCLQTMRIRLWNLTTHLAN